MEDLIRTIGQTIIDTYTKAAEDAARIVPKELADKDIQISNLNSRILALEAECRDRAAHEEAMSAEISAFKRTVQQYAEENAARSKKADQYAIVIRQQEDIIKRRNATIKQQEQTIGTQSGTIRAMQVEVGDLHTTINRLQTEPRLVTLNKKLTAAQNQVKSFRDTIEQQKAQIISMEAKLQQPIEPQMVPTIQVGRVTWNAEEIQKMVDTNVKQAQEIERLRRIPKQADVIYVGQHPYDVAGINMLLSTIAQLRSEIQGLRSTAPIIKVEGQYMTAQQVEAMKKKLDELREDEPRKQAIAKRAESTLAATRRHIVAWRTRARNAEEQLKKYKDVEDFERRQGTMLDAEARAASSKKNADFYREELVKERNKVAELNTEIGKLQKRVSYLESSLRTMTDDRDNWRGKAAELMNHCTPTKETLQELVEHYVQTAKTVTTPDNCVRAVIKTPDQVKVVIGGDEFPAEDIREAFAALSNVNKGLCVIDGIIYYYKDIQRMTADIMSKQESIRVVTDANTGLSNEVKRLQPFEEEVKKLRQEVTTLRLAKKIHDGRRQAQSMATHPVSSTKDMKPGVEYMTTPCGMLPVDSDGMRYLVDRLATAYAVNEELNRTLRDFTNTVQGLINKP